jgi:hypothetical protein
VTVHSLRTRTLLVAPIRLALGVVWLVAARLAGSHSGPALLGFVVGGLGIAFLIFNDPRSRFVQGEVEPLSLPAAARVAAPWRQALAATLPSTVGVSVLAAIAVATRPTLGALLGGVSAGLGLAALISVTRITPGLYVDPKTHVIYRR